MRAFLSQYSRAFRDGLPHVYCSLRRVETESHFLRIYVVRIASMIQLDFYAQYTQR